MINHKRSRLNHASGTTTGAEAATFTAEERGRPGQMPMAAALAAHSQKTILKPTTSQIVLELARDVPW